MKKLLVLTMLFFTALFSYASYNGTVLTNQNELSFSNNGNYNVVSFTNGLYTEEIGAPQLPVKIFSFLIPVDKKVSDIVINSTGIMQLPGSYNIYPVQTPVPTNMSPDAMPFDDPNPLIYDSNNPYPGKLYEIIDDGFPMGYHVVTIKFYPVEYIPSSGILNLYTNINFTIVLENNNESILLPNKQTRYSSNLSKAFIRSMVENPGDIITVSGGAREIVDIGNATANLKGMNPTSLTYIPDYIIITRNDLMSSFQPLADWKTQKGVNTLIVDVHNIYSNYQGYDNAEKIRNYLKDVYVNFGSSYVLLGGDVDIIPTRFTPIYTGSYETDYYYATVQGNWNSNGNNIFGETGGGFGNPSSDNPDMSNVFFVGRAPVHNATEAINFVNKVISYEMFDNPYTTNKDYVKNMSFWAGNDGGSGTFTSLNSIDATYLNPVNYYVLKLYDPFESATALNILSVIGDGLTTTVTCGTPHGIETGDMVSMKNWNVTLGSVNGIYSIIKESNTEFTFTSSGNGAATSGNGWHFTIRKDGSLYPERFDYLKRINVINSLNTGWINFGQSFGNVHLIYHCDHSGPDAMGTSAIYLKEHISKSDMDGLTNMNGSLYYPQILYSDGCHPNQFSLDAISEHYINNPNGGGVAFIGNSDAGYWGNHTYFTNNFGKALYDLSKPDAYNNIYYHIGYANLTTVTGLTQRKKNRNLLGDPEMMIWTETPQNLTVSNLIYSSTNKQITGTVSGLTFSSTSQVIVTIYAWKGDEIYASQEISATTASINFLFNNVFADTPGNITVTVTAHNYIPNIGTINVALATDAHPYLTSFTVDDNNTNGNNDQQADAGETIYLPIILTNSGNVTANNVTATLSWLAKSYQTQSGTGATITINTSSCNFGDIPASSGTANNLVSPFVFTINKDAFEITITPRPLTQFIEFTLTVFVDGIEFSEKSFEIQIAEPNLVKGENVVTGTLAAGSTNQLTVKLYNSGLSEATGLSATLSTNNPSNISITNAVSSYPDITGVNTTTNSETNTVSFVFNVGSNDYTIEEFNLTVTNAFGKEWVFSNFNLSRPIIDVDFTNIDVADISITTDPPYSPLTMGSTNHINFTLHNNGTIPSMQLTGYYGNYHNVNYPSIFYYSYSSAVYNSIIPGGTGSGIINVTFPTSSTDWVDYSINPFLNKFMVRNECGKEWYFENFLLTDASINLSKTNIKIQHEGYSTSIKLFWTVALTEPLPIKGYNIYRSFNQSGPYSKMNTDIVIYSSFLDEGLQQLTTYFYKITAIDINGNESDFFPSTGHLASTSLNPHNGWPITATSQNEMGNRAEGSPTVYDINGDNKKEIFFTTGSLGSTGGVWGFKEDGSRWFMLDGNPTNTSGIINLECYTTATPALADIDNDGVVDMGITSRSVATANGQKLLIYEPGNDENPTDNLPDLKLSLPGNGWEINKGNVFTDINGDGTLESLFATQVGGIRIYNSNGTDYANWNSTSGIVCGYNMPVAYDFDNNGKKEIVVCTQNDGIYIFKEDGTNYNSTNPIYVPTSGWRTDFPPVVTDINNDGIYEILFICAQNLTANIYALMPDGNFLAGWDPNNEHPSFTLSTSVSGDSYWSQFCPSFSVGDINKDGFPEVVCGDAGHLYVWNYNGGNAMVDIPIINYTSRTEKAPLIADVDNDDSDLEIIVTNTIFSPSTVSSIYAFKIDGASYQPVAGFPISLDYNIANTPCVDDIDNNGKNELIVTTPAKYFVWDTFGEAVNNIYGWLSYRHDAQNTGVYENICQYLTNGLEIGSSYPTVTTWSNNQTLNRNLIIKQGKTLVIKSTIKLNKNSKIIIEQGAKLIIDNGVLTNSECENTLWQGIEVWGTSSASQYPALNNPNQGRIELKNGAVIENALTGIKVFATDANGNVVSGTTGGIVIANSTTFRNNKVDVQFEPYTNFYPTPTSPRNNLSYFKNCTFETTRELNDNNVVPSAHILLNGVNGINILGNIFRNSSYQSFVATERGIGIKATNSGFNANAYCTSMMLPCNNYKKNEFENLLYGIYVQNSTSVYPVNINRNIFTNNTRGIFLSGVNYPTVTLNDINIGSDETVTSLQGSKSNIPPPIGFYLSSYGLYLANISNFNIQENSFFGTGNSSYGSLVWNGGATAKDYYNNDFKDLKFGFQSSSNNSGLQIKCNDFISNITIAAIGITSGSIANTQGICSDIYTPAGNKFCHTSGSIDVKANAGVSLFTYKHHSGSEMTPTVSPSWILTPTSDCQISCNNQCCPSRLNSGLTPVQLLTKISSSNSNISTLSSNIDGGSTQAMLDKVNSGMSTGQLKNVLVNASPYLSDTVMIATMERSSPLSPGHLKQVLVGNSPLTNKVMNVVDQQSLPPGIKTQILAAQTGEVSERAILEQEISRIEAKRTLAVSELIQLYAEDTTGEGLTSIITFLETQPDVNSKQMLVQAYYSLGECNEAQTLLEQLPKISKDETDFYTLYSVLTELCTSGNTIYDLSAGQKQIIETLAMSNSMVSANAQAIMSLVYGNWYWEKIEELLDFNMTTIKGTLFNSPECDNAPVPNDTIILVDENEQAILSITPAVTDENGEFIFSPSELLILDTTAIYTLKTKSGFALTEQPYQLISEWISQSPLSLTLKNVNLEWYDLYDSPESIWTIGTSIDISGNIYVSGRTMRTLTNSDVAVVKYSPTGQKLWVRTFDSGVATYDNSDDMVLDANGNCYLSITSENTNTVIVKYSSAGQLLWQKTISTTSILKYDARQIELAPNGDIIIGGIVVNTTDNSSDIFIAAYDINGNRRWLRTLNIDYFDHLNDMKTDKSGNIIITGQIGNSSACLTAKFNKNGTLLWSKLYNSGNDYTYGLKILADNSGSIYVVGNYGRSLSSVFDLHMFLLKYNANGVQQWLTSNTNGTPSGLCYDSNASLYLGYTSPSFKISCMKYDLNGNVIWDNASNSPYNSSDMSNSIAIDNNNSIYCTGRLALDPVFYGYKKVLLSVLKFNSSGDIAWQETLSVSSNVNVGNDIAVSENKNVYVTGYSNIGGHNNMITLKYSQCPSLSNLKSNIINDNFENSEDDEGIQVINFKDNTIIVYPNPYTDNTLIELTALVDSDVKLEVFTLTGQCITDIYTGEVKKGKYTYNFSAKKLGYSAGTYILRATINNEVSNYWLVELK